MEQTARASSHTNAHAERYDWSFYGGLEGHVRMRVAAAKRFVRDLQTQPAPYVAGSLPHLPLPTGSFQLALSSRLLFTYADRLDAEFHVAAIGELARVAREVRVYPLVDHTGAPRAELVAQVSDRLTADRVRVQVRRVPYRFQPAATHMLVAARAGSPHRADERSPWGR